MLQGIHLFRLMTMTYINFIMKLLNAMNMMLCALDNQNACDALLYVHLTNQQTVLIGLKDHLENMTTNYTVL